MVSMVIKIVGVFIILVVVLMFVVNILTSSTGSGLISPKTLPVSKIINGSLGNNFNANYSSHYKVAVNITKKYNEPINNTILFTGNSSNMTIETYYQMEFSTVGTSYNLINYHGLYVPIYENISDVYINGSSYISSLINKVVYIEFNATYDNNSVIQVPYIVQSEKISGTYVYWYLTQDTGISNSTAINANNENNSELINTTTYIIGIYYNGTEILFPRG